MTRLFTGVAPGGGGREDMMNGAWSPRVDIFENKDNLVLEAELPGMDQNDFELSFENNVLTLSGERKFEKKTEEGDYRIVDVVGVSETSWEDAGRQAVKAASKSLRDLRIAEVVKMDMKVEDGKVVAFRTRVALSFKYEG